MILCRSVESNVYGLMLAYGSALEVDLGGIWKAFGRRKQYLIAIT